MAEREHLIRVATLQAGYADDYAAWLASQADLLRRRQFDRLDLVNLVDEVESLGRSDFGAFVSAIEIVLMHMLKWDYQPERRSRSWSSTIVEHRRRIARELADSPSYKVRIDEAVARAYEVAPAAAAAETGLPLTIFPEINPYGWDEITNREHAIA